MAMIDITTYMEQSGMRKARFGGYEPEDVRQAMLALCGEYEQGLTRAETTARAAVQEAEALRRRCQTLQGQNRTLASQNANLATRADQTVRSHDTLSTQLASLGQRNRSLTDQCAVLRMKNSDLTRENEEIKEKAAQAEAALRVKGKELEEARLAVEKEREALLEEARKQADEALAAAREEGAQLVRDAELKAEAIDTTAREQAVAQARKLVQSASDETKEIQSAHRLRLADLKRQIEVMERRRTELLEYLSRMGNELRDIEALARQEAPIPPETEEEARTPEPELDLSDSRLNEAADALRTAKTTQPSAAARPGVSDATPQHTTRVVAPGTLPTETASDPTKRKPRQPQRGAPSPDFFDVPDKKQDAERVPGAIFSYPILRQRGEPILLEDPPLRGPHTPVMPTDPQLDDEGEQGYEIGFEQEDDDKNDPAAEATQRPGPVPEPVNSTQSKRVRRRKALAAVRAIQRRREELDPDRGGIRLL